MPIKDYLADDAVWFLASREKAAAFRELAVRFCEKYPDVAADELHGRIWEREKEISTWVSRGIAIPHAILERAGGTRIAVGISHDGIDYSAPDELPVQLIVLIVGNDLEHLTVLRQVALRLSAPYVFERVLEARDEQEAFRAFTETEQAASPGGAPADWSESRLCFDHAWRLAAQISANAVMVYADCTDELDFLPADPGRSVFLVTTARVDELSAKFPQHPVIQIPFKGVNRNNQIELSIIFALSRGLIRKGDRVVSVFGVPSSGTLDSIRLTDVDREFSMFFSLWLKDQRNDISHQVFARVLEIASELAEEGREGHPCGTIFVLGDYENSSQHCQQMIINPFKGYAEQERNILDPSLKETVKELAKIDGAFLLRGDGVIMSAGTYIRTRLPLGDLVPGLGSRHAAAAAITTVTQAVALALSQSTRLTSVFRAGQRVLEL